MASAKQAARFAAAKHFNLVITSPHPAPRTPRVPVRIYNPTATVVGGRVVLVCNDQDQWIHARVLYYNSESHSWRLVHSYGPRRERAVTPATGLDGDCIYAVEPDTLSLSCFDVVLEHWVAVELTGELPREMRKSFCEYVETARSFVLWDVTMHGLIRVLKLDTLQWESKGVKGEGLARTTSSPVTCAYGNTVYVVCESGSAVLYLLTHRERSWTWSRPKISGVVPPGGSEASLAYSSGRLFLYGGFRPVLSSRIDMYSIEDAEWHELDSVNPNSEYTVKGDVEVTAGSHSAVALQDRIIVFGGFSCLFRSCRVLLARE